MELSDDLIMPNFERSIQIIQAVMVYEFSNPPLSEQICRDQNQNLFLTWWVSEDDYNVSLEVFSNLMLSGQCDKASS